MHVKRSASFVGVLLSLLAVEAAAGEAFLKGGIDLRDSSASGWGLADRWLVSVGYDWQAARFAHLGFEVQSGYQSFAIGGKIQAKVVPLNAFFNLRVTSDAPAWRPYAGGGVGLMSQFDWERVPFFPEVVNTFHYHRDLGVHFFGGIQIHRRFFFEYMAQTALGETSLVGTAYRWSHLLMGGVIW